jgi:hypothetical protein
MTLNDFRAWLDGFVEGAKGDPTPEHLEAIRAKLATVAPNLPSLASLGPIVSPSKPPPVQWPPPINPSSLGPCKITYDDPVNTTVTI